MGNRLLITGATGFIGRRILMLDATPAFDIIYTARKAQRLNQQSIHALDFTGLTDLELTRFMDEHQPTHLLHTAWYTGDGFYHSAENISWLAHSARLFRAFLEAGGRSIATAGSCAQYAATSGGVLHEDARSNDATLYAAAKNAVQRIQFAACAQFGARSAWGRLSFVYGPDEPARKLLRSTAAHLVACDPVTIREPHKRADFLHVVDAARGLLMLATSEQAAGVYNIASGETPALRDIILELRDLCNSRSEITMGEVHAPDVLLSYERIRGLGFRPLYPMSVGLAEMATAAISDKGQ